MLKAIFTKPIQFVKNLINAASTGFKNFGKNFLTHLKDAIFDWLTGSLEGIQLPSSWDLKGIASVALQMLGLTWANIRGKLVKLIGETTVKAMETGFDLVVTLVKDGPMAAWEKIKEMADDIKGAFIEGVQDFIKIKIIQKAIETIISLFVPGAGIVRAIMGIYDTIVFFIQKAKQIAQMVGNFLGSIGEIAAGNIGAAAAALEKGLATALKLVINFLAKFLRLDGITAKIRAAIQKLRDKVDKMLDRVVEWIVGMARRLGRFVLQAVTPSVRPTTPPGLVAGGGAAAILADREVPKQFSLTGEGHTLKIVIRGGRAEILMASVRFDQFRFMLQNAMAEVRNDPGLNSTERTGILQTLQAAFSKSDGNEIVGDFFRASRTDPTLQQSKNQDHYFELRLQQIVDPLTTLRVFNIKSLEDFHKRRGRDHGPYSNLPEFTSVVESGREFTAAERSIIINTNRSRNGGVVKSDLSRTVLQPPPSPGQPYNPLAWHVDHIIARSRGGANSVTNAQVLSAAENLSKSDR